MEWLSQRMIISILKFRLLKFLFLIALAHFSFASEINESEVDWELIIPQEILQGTVCKWEITEEERLFIESLHY
jgi:hypothetical protein